MSACALCKGEGAIGGRRCPLCTPITRSLDAPLCPGCNRPAPEATPPRCSCSNPLALVCRRCTGRGAQAPMVEQLRVVLEASTSESWDHLLDRVAKLREGRP